MILVTGGTGLVGAHLLLSLAESKVPLRAIYRTDNSRKKTKKLFAHYGKEALYDTIEWVQGDVLDIPSLEIAFEGVEYVYHCAAVVSFDPSDEEILRKTNIEGTANMVNCALAFGVQKFCHVSSIAALGDATAHGGTITEETEWNPEKSHSDYAISKYGAEMEVWRAWQEGLNVVVVNPGVIFGYGFWQQGSGAILRAVQRGQYFYTLGNCAVVAVTDVVAVMIQLMQSSNTGERYTVVAENITYKTLLDIVANGLGKTRPYIYATPLLTRLAWRADWLLSKFLRHKRMLTRSMAKSAHSTEVYDSSKLKTAINFSFSDTTAFIKQLCSSFKTKV
ncbi:NAD-dependent epimerase/dehydratase family protein [Flavobacterium sp. Sd200]|uniref:NAD-dependent epimerase/dehydratase family protein n=1 Tax=Flavobacterium sp. Sd200 TaxID=2692211 RepID=UPI00136D15FF|nr:NAD-dependent epimerase/dehydratase family protein [Flavobacterium sp. Sd200]MXN92134.1 NAD-dependent epimerase/dehydratase family protein [Flavobacterium sp. Sd200]